MLSSSLDPMVERVRVNREHWIQLANEGSKPEEAEMEKESPQGMLRSEVIPATDPPCDGLSSLSSLGSSSPDTHQEDMKYVNDSDSSDRLRLLETQENPIVGIVGNDRSAPIAVPNRRDHKLNHDT